jgi:hypothetical protein
VKRSRISLNVPVLLAMVLALLALLLLAPMSNVLFAALRAIAKAPARQSGTPPPSAPTHSAHSVVVTFDYDFGRTPACTPKIQKHCTAQFVVYDISAGVPRRSRLFTIPLPDGAKGMVHGVTATSPKLDFESGQHQLAVTAQEPDGTESPNFAASVWIVIP